MKLRQRTFAGLLERFPLRTDKAKDDFLRRIERLLTSFDDTEKRGEFDEPSDIRPTLRALARAEKAWTRAALALGPEEKQWMAIALILRNDQIEPGSQMVDAIEKRLAAATADSAALGEIARQASAAFAEDTKRGPKANKRARFLMEEAALLWDEFSSVPLVLKKGDCDQGAFIAFVRWLWRFKRVRMPGGELAGEKMAREVIQNYLSPREFTAVLSTVTNRNTPSMRTAPATSPRRNARSPKSHAAPLVPRQKSRQT